MSKIPHLTTGYQYSGESRIQVKEGWSPPYELTNPQYRELTIYMAECRRLAFVPFIRVENWPKLLRGSSKGCDM